MPGVALIDDVQAGFAAVATYLNNQNTWSVIARSAVQHSHTGSTAEVTVYTVTVPAGLAGPNSIFRISDTWGLTGSASKSLRIKFGGTTILTATGTTTMSVDHVRSVANRNSLTAQITPAPFRDLTATSQGPLVMAINTANAFDITFTVQLTNAAESAGLDFFMIEHCHGDAV